MDVPESLTCMDVEAKDLGRDPPKAEASLLSASGGLNFPIWIRLARRFFGGNDG